MKRCFAALLIAVFCVAAWWSRTGSPPGAETPGAPAIAEPPSEVSAAKSTTGGDDIVIGNPRDIAENPDLVPRRYVITGLTSPQEIIDLVGVPGDYDRWMKSRGHVFEEELMPSYLTFSEQELRQLHEQGDVVASALLANKLMNQRSPEALDISRQLVADGSIFSMSSLSVQYLMLAGAMDGEGGQRDESRTAYPGDRESMLVEAMAWSLLGETYDGMPRGSLIDPWDEMLTRSGDDPVDLAVACQRAAELQADLAYEWDSAGFTTPDIEPRPFYYGRADHSGWVVDACPDSVLTMPDLARCIPVELVDEYGDIEEAMVCPTD